MRGRKLVLVRPAMAAGEEVKAHPLWHALVAGRPSLEERISARAETILRHSAPNLAGRSLKRFEVEPGGLPVATCRMACAARCDRSAQIRIGEFAVVPAELPIKMDAAIMSANLRGSARQSLAGGDALFGTLAHLIAESLFQPGAPPDPDPTATLARARLEEFLPQMAATLLLPGSARDLAAARQAIPEALAELARFLRANKLDVVATEQDFQQEPEASGAKTGIAGAIDLLAQDQAGRPVVIDLKWQRSDKYRRKEIADGVAIQLAVYAKHIDGEKLDVPTGYFMLRQKRFVTGSPGFSRLGRRRRGTGRARNLDENRNVLGRGDGRNGRRPGPRDFRRRRASLKRSLTTPILMTPPNCNYCDYTVLCGRER